MGKKTNLGIICGVAVSSSIFGLGFTMLISSRFNIVKGDAYLLSFFLLWLCVLVFSFSGIFLLIRFLTTDDNAHKLPEKSERTTNHDKI